MSKEVLNRKVAVFTGAGISAESGIATFRTGEDASWSNFDMNTVATLAAWDADKETVLEFYNDRTLEMLAAEPNEAHKALGRLQEHCPTTVITQNIDDLHERGGSTDVLHIHGYINQARSTVDKNLVVDHKGPINLGDKCPKGSQLRPHVVWFYEYPYFMFEAQAAIKRAGYLIIVGTALQIEYTSHMLSDASKDCQIFFIDPSPVKYLDSFGMHVNYIEGKASVELPKLVDKIINYEI